MTAGGQCLHSRQLHTSALGSGTRLELDSGTTYNVEDCTTEAGGRQSEAACRGEKVDSEVFMPGLKLWLS